MANLPESAQAAGKATAAQASTTPVAAAPVQAPATDLATLQSQMGELRIQQQGLQAQWDGLYEQLQKMSESNPARPGVQQAWADVGVQLAKVKGDIAHTEARISQVQGGWTGWTSEPPPPPPSRGPDPDLIVGGSIAVAMALVLPISLAWARRIFRGRPQPAAASPDQTMRFERMENAIDAMSIEIERVLEGQRFVTKILAERPDRVSAPEQNASAASAAPQPKALGAGPVEPIVVPQRERVRSSVTPH